jgi:hypothetical protein
MANGSHLLEGEPATSEPLDDRRPAPDATPATRSPQATFLRRWLAAFLLLAVLSTAWSLVTPPAGGPDEQYHAIKAAAVVTGQFTGRPDPVIGGGSTFVDVSARWERLDYMPGCFAFHPTVSAECAGSLDGPTADKDVRTRAGISPPFFHGVVGLPMHLSPTLNGFYLSRLIASLVAATLVSAALTLAVAARSWFLAGAVLVSWTPVAAFLAGVLNPSSLEISAATLVWVSGLLIVRPEGVPDWLQRRLVWFLLAAAVPFVLSRQASPVLLACIVAVLAIAVPWARLRALLVDRRLWLPAAVTVGATVVALGWQAVNQPGAPGDVVPAEYGRRDMVTVPLGRLGEMYEQMIGMFGWLDTRPPSLVLLGWTAAIALLVALGATLGPRRIVVAAGVLAVGTVVVYVGIEGSVLRENGPIFQGRYLLPLAMGVVLLAGRGIDEGAGALRERLWPMLWILVGLVVSAHFVSIWFTARRFAVGIEGPVWFLGTERWQPAIPQGMALAVAVAALVGLVAWVRAAVRHPVATAV